jgi:polyisoprenoid-binding protein YceI
MRAASILVGCTLVFVPMRLALSDPAVGTEEGEHAYLVDAEESTLFVVVRKDSSTLLSNAAHDHVIRASQMNGKVIFDPNQPAECRIELVVPVAGLRADEPEMRRKVALAGGKEPLDKDRAGVEKSMRGADQLDAERFPMITFHSTSCAPAGEDAIEVKGDFTVHGATKLVDVRMQFHFEGGALRARGRFTATHEDFGMKPYSAALGTIKNGDVLTFGLDVKADPRS